MSNTRYDKDGRCIPERDMKLHGNCFHCSCGEVIHESALHLPDLWDQNRWLQDRVKELETAAIRVFVKGAY